jgi:hypothetical protein
MYYLKSIFLLLFYSNPSELNEVLSFAKKIVFPGFLIGKIGGSPYTRAYTVSQLITAAC